MDELVAFTYKMICVRAMEGAMFGSLSTCRDKSSSFFCTGSGFGCHYLHLHKGKCQTDQYLEGCRVYKPFNDGCPGCKTNVKRANLSNLNVQCTICTADKKKVYQFCWQCLKPWKGKAPRSDRCDNDGCINHNLEILKNCKTALPQVQGVDACPSIRACPTCGQRVEHDKTGCKNIICPRCQVEFCFVCLKLKPECLETE